MEIAPRITAEADKCGGRACIRGMRMRVVDVLEMLAGGSTVEEILADFPSLEAEDIPAALSYAAFVTSHSVAMPPPLQAESQASAKAAAE